MNYPIPDNPILDIIISIVLIFAFLSILVSILLEWYNFKSHARSVTLQDAIHNLINDKTGINYGYLFYNHFMINGLKHNKSHSIQYISSSMFADVLIDIIANQYEHAQDIDITTHPEKEIKTYHIKPNPEASPTMGFNAQGARGNSNNDNPLMERFENALRLMRPGQLNSLLKTFNEKAGGDYTKIKIIIEQWYNDYMARVSGWYKVSQRNKLTIAGFIIAIALNVDSLHLIRCLSYDPTLRSQLVQQATEVADNYQALPASEKNNTAALENLVLKISSDSTLSANERYKTIMDITNLNVKNSAQDSMYKARADSVLDVMSDLNIPLGWGYDTAPLSYFKTFNPNVVDKAKIESFKAVRNTSLINYLNFRNNCPTWGNWVMYLLGITITAYSLSFGAPFWFDLLIKLVNLRRAGKKPKD